MSVYKGPTLPMSSSVGHSLRGGWVVLSDSVRFYLVVVVDGWWFQETVSDFSSSHRWKN